MDNETLATELLKEQKANAKRWFIAFLVVLALWFATIAGFIAYLSIPSEVSQTSVDQQTDSGGNNQIVGGDYFGNPTENNENNG